MEDGRCQNPPAAVSSQKQHKESCCSLHAAPSLTGTACQGHSITCSRGWELPMVPPLRQGHLRNSSHGQPWWVAAQVTGQKAFPKGAGAEMAAAQLVPRAEGQQTVTAKGHQLSGREAPPVCDTCHGAQRHRVTRPPAQAVLSSVVSRHFSCARAGGCLLPSTGRLSCRQCHLITIQGQPTRSPLQHPQCP